MRYLLVILAILFASSTSLAGQDVRKSCRDFCRAGMSQMKAFQCNYTPGKPTKCICTCFNGKNFTVDKKTSKKECKPPKKMRRNKSKAA
jgi:hypothetical protein